MDLQHDYKSARTDFAREQVHLSRLKAELNGKDELDQRGFEKLPLPGPVLAELVRSESELLKTNQTAFQQDRASLLTGMKQADEETATLTVQEREEQRGVQADTEELDRVNKAFGSGNLPSPRVAEGRRALLLSSTRRLQTTVRLMEVKRLRDEFASRLDSLNSQHRINLIRELKETNARLDDINLRLETAAAKLSEGARAAVMPGDAFHSEIAIIRKNELKLSRIPADEDTDLEPGDVVEVTVRPDYITGLAAQ
jgi:polysaccharide export outer membrane protein